MQFATVINRAVVSGDMFRSRDTIFQSLGLVSALWSIVIRARLGRISYFFLYAELEIYSEKVETNRYSMKEE